MVARMRRRRSDRNDHDTDPDGDVRLPLGVTSGTNGEYVPDPPTPHDLDVEQAALRAADDAARRVGIDRRAFLQTAGGVAVVLATIDLAACSSSGSGRAALSSTVPVPTTGPGGSFTVPPTTDVEACEAELGSRGEFIFDVHTHHVMPQGAWRENAPQIVDLVLGMLPPGCSAADPLECANRAAYLHDLFLASDTTVAMLSDVPVSGPETAPVPFPDMLGTQKLAAELTKDGAPRVLVHNVIAPNFGPLPQRLDEMEAAASTGKVAAFKLYPAYGPNGQGYGVDDPAIGLPVIDKARDLGVKIIIAHKGLPLVNFDFSRNGPDDMVAASRVFPDTDFVIFHAAWDKDRTEGPYDPGAGVGIDTVLRALDDHGVAPNSNVWVDLGSVWREALKNPTEAAHVLGKLLSRVGEDRVLWGTDAVWYGSPQAQIQAFRAFEISDEFQDVYGYPALTDRVKSKVLGLNAAKLFGVDPTATRCAFTADPLALAQPAAAELRADGLIAAGRPNGPVTRREMLAWLADPVTRWTPY
jgi:predicted TIM-barrel fold metal-dependent hydrolase